METQFISLIDEHRHMIAYAHNRYARTLDAEDVAQEILLNAWRSFPNFKQKCKFSTWFYKICRNVCIDCLRRCLALPVIVPITGDIPDMPYTDDVAQKKLLEWQYNTAMDALHPIERKYFRLYLDGLSFKQIEHITSVDESTMRVRIHRIKVKLTKRFYQTNT